MYAYCKFIAGDEMSKRPKFVLITWIGATVSPLKKAKVSTDKAFVKALIKVNLFVYQNCCFINIYLLGILFGNSGRRPS